MDILDGVPPPPNPPTMNAKKQHQIIRSFSNDNSSAYKFNTGKTPPLTPSRSVKKNSKCVNVKIVLLDDTATILQVQVKTIGRVIFDQICKQLNILECDYFGLEYVDSNGTHHYIDLEKKLNHQVGLNLNEPVLKFVVKFYTPDPLQLEEEFTRYLFSLQIRKDLATGLLQCNDNTAALMASYLVQAECGDFNEEDYPDASYLNKHLFVPNQDYEIENRIRENHKKHIGQSPAEADLHLLEVARRTEFYGIKLTPAKDEDGVVLNLAVSHMGILIFQGNTKINIFSWSKIRKISFKRKRFLLKLHPEGYGYYKETIDFIFEGRNECKTFWKRCVEHHSFFRCDKAPLPSSASRSKGLLNSRGSSFRYSGRTQKQMVSFVRENFIKRSTTPTSMNNQTPNMQQRVLPSSFQRSSSFRSNAEAAQSGVSTSCSSPAMIISSNDRIIEINNSKHDSDSQPEDTISPGTSINSSPQHNVPMYYHHHDGVQFPQQPQGQIYNSAQSITSFTYENEFPVTTYKSNADDIASSRSKGRRSKSLLNKKSSETIASATSTKECHDTTSHGSYDLLEGAGGNDNRGNGGQYEFNEFVPYLLRRRIDFDDTPNHTKLYKSKSFSNTINKKKIKLAKYLSYNSIGYYYSWQDDTYDDDFDGSFEQVPLPAPLGERNRARTRGDEDLHAKHQQQHQQQARASVGDFRAGVNVDDLRASAEGEAGVDTGDEVYELPEEVCKAAAFNLSDAEGDEEVNQGEEEEDEEEDADITPQEIVAAPVVPEPADFEMYEDEQGPPGEGEEDEEEDSTEAQDEEEAEEKSDEVPDEVLPRDDVDVDIDEDADGDEVPGLSAQGRANALKFSRVPESFEEVPDIFDEIPGDLEPPFEQIEGSKSDEIYELESNKSDIPEELEEDDEEFLIPRKRDEFPKPDDQPFEAATIKAKMYGVPEPGSSNDPEISDEAEVMYEEDEEDEGAEEEEFEEWPDADPAFVEAVQARTATIRAEVEEEAEEIIYETLKMIDDPHIYDSLVELKGNGSEISGESSPGEIKEVGARKVSFDINAKIQEGFDPDGEYDDHEHEPLEPDFPPEEEAAEKDTDAAAAETTPTRPQKQVMFFIEDDEDSEETNTIESERIRLSDFNKMKLLLNQLENLKEVQKIGPDQQQQGHGSSGSMPVLPEILEDEDSVDHSDEPEETLPTATLSMSTAKMVDIPRRGSGGSTGSDAEPKAKTQKMSPSTGKPEIAKKPPELVKKSADSGVKGAAPPSPPGCSKVLANEGLTKMHSSTSSMDSDEGSTPLEPIPEAQEEPGGIVNASVPIKVLYFENKCLPERSFPTKQLETLEEEPPDVSPAAAGPPIAVVPFAPTLRKSSTPSLDELPLPPTPPYEEIDEELETPKYPIPPPTLTDPSAAGNRRFSFNKSRSSTDSSEQRKKLSRTFSIDDRNEDPAAGGPAPALPVRTSSNSSLTKSSTEKTESTDLTYESDNSSSEHSPDIPNVTTNLFINFPNHRTLSRISEQTHSSEDDGTATASSNFRAVGAGRGAGGSGGAAGAMGGYPDGPGQENLKYADGDDVSGLTINTVPLVTLTSELCDSSATLNDFDEIEEEVREGNVELHRAYLNLNVVNGEIQF